MMPQPEASALKPGLAVKYYYEYWRHIDELKSFMKSNKGATGEPILMRSADIHYSTRLRRYYFLISLLSCPAL